jgi:AcrR family transcriptional regulator
MIEMAVTETVARKRNAETTRAALLKAALNRFVREGYDGVSLRDIATDAGVDVALVSRYFGGKLDLFAEVMATSPSPTHLFEGDHADFGERISAKLVIEKQESKDFDCLVIMLRSASSPDATEIIRRMGEERFYGPFAKWLGGRDAKIRARLVADIIKGVTLDRVMAEDFGFTPDAREKFRARLARTLQAAIDP